MIANMKSTLSPNERRSQNSRIRRLDTTSKTRRRSSLSHISDVLCIVTLLSTVHLPLYSHSFQPQNHQHYKSTTTRSTFLSRNIPSIPSSSSAKRSSKHFFALDYRDVSTRSKSSRLSLSSIAIPASTSASSFVNDGTDYYSWLSSGWGNGVTRNTNNNVNVFTAPPQQLSKQQQQSTLSQTEEYQRRKEEWAKRYTSLNGLRKAFGSNRNKLWGDLDPATTRKLYKSLLPNALCELVMELGVEPEELAPLAYQARKAAKLYARERCQVPARIAANLYDGFRQWRRYGRFQPSGMSYEQLWDKYYRQQLEQVGSSLHDFRNNDKDGEYNLHLDDTVTEEEIVSQTCQKILEKACTTNEMVDDMVFQSKNIDHDDVHDDRKQHRNDLLLKRISRTLERDVRKLLEPTTNENDELSTDHHRRTMTPQEYHALKLFALSRKQFEGGHPYPSAR